MTPVKKTPEQIDKEKADKIENTPSIQPNKADLEEPIESIPELGKSKPVDIIPPKESDRQYAKKVGDYKRVVQMAKEKGVDLNNIGAMPLMDSDKGKITEAVKSAYGRELATGIQGISNAITAPKNEERNKLDAKALMALEKQKRRARLADAFYAFGEGLQGKTANSENFVSTKIQRNQDKQFQDFKDTTERNQKTKYLWENQSRKELIDWAEKESSNMKQDQEYRDKMKMIVEQNAQDQNNKERGFKIQEDRNNIARDKKSGNATKTKEKTVNIKTAKKTYELKPEDADYYRSEILKNAEILEEKYPGWFTVTQSSKEDRITRKPILGPKTYKLNPDVKDTDIIREFLVEEENRKQHEANGYSQFENNKANLQKIYKERGDLNEQPKQASKSDPLELFLVKDAPRTQPQKQTTQKSQYSTGGLY